jgi:branched-chain amino acid aminotransferase
MHAVDADAFLKALLAAPRPGAENILAFYDHRAGRICTDGRYLLLPLDDHICHRGDGLFESICYRERTIFGLDEHLARLQNGAQALSLAPPCPWEELRERICDVARASGQDNGDLRVFLSRGPGGFGISPAECPTAGLYIVALRAALPAPELYERGLTAFASAVPPKQEYLARIKNTNYLPNVFMAMEAARKGMDVGVTFDENGIMGEAAVANVALVDREGRLVCPEIKRILPGTTLLTAMQLAAEHRPVVQMPIPRAAIDEADELLLFTSATLCVGITHFDGKPVGRGEHAGRPGPVALDLKDALLAHMLARGARF